MPEGEAQTENAPEESPKPAAPKKSGGIKDYLVYLLPFAPVILNVLLFAVFIAIVIAILSKSQAASTPDFSGQNGQITCTTWASDTNGYQKIFTAAASNYGISPALVGAIFMSEHGGSITATAPWATSPAGASGPFQFMPSTWSSNGVDGDKDGKKDVNNFTDASFGAARYLQSIISNYDNKNWLAADQNDIEIIGACYNWGCGGDNLTNVKNYLNGQSNNVPTETKNYMTNIWNYFQGLNVGCQNMTAYGSLVGYLNQCDSRWQKDPNAAMYFPAAKSFCGAGCGVTSSAMVVNALKGGSVTPNQVAAKFSACTGGAALFSATCLDKNFGLTLHLNDVISQNQAIPVADIQNELSQKHQVIMRIEPDGSGYVGPKGGKNPKSSHSGHYLVVTGTTSDSLITDDPMDGAGTIYPLLRADYNCTLKFFSFG